MKFSKESEKNPSMDTTQFVTELSKLRTASTFLTLHGYRNDASEIADYNIVFHMSYENALKKSIETLSALDLEGDLEKQARFELIESFTRSLGNMASTAMEELDDHIYTHFKDDDGQYIKGVKMHNESGELHLYGLIVHKRTRLPGIYPTKNKRPLTIAKDKLRYLTPVGKFRQFKLNPSQVDSITVEKLELLPPE